MWSPCGCDSKAGFEQGACQVDLALACCEGWCIMDGLFLARHRGEWVRRGRVQMRFAAWIVDGAQEDVGPDPEHWCPQPFWLVSSWTRLRRHFELCRQLPLRIGPMAQEPDGPWVFLHRFQGRALLAHRGAGQMVQLPAELQQATLVLFHGGVQAVLVCERAGAEPLVQWARHFLTDTLHRSEEGELFIKSKGVVRWRSDAMRSKRRAAVFGHTTLSAGEVVCEVYIHEVSDVSKVWWAMPHFLNYLLGDIPYDNYVGKCWSSWVVAGDAFGQGADHFSSSLKSVFSKASRSEEDVSQHAALSSHDECSATTIGLIVLAVKFASGAARHERGARATAGVRERSMAFVSCLVDRVCRGASAEIAMAHAGATIGTLHLVADAGAPPSVSLTLAGPRAERWDESFFGGRPLHEVFFSVSAVLLHPSQGRVLGGIVLRSGVLRADSHRHELDGRLLGAVLPPRLADLGRRRWPVRTGAEGGQVGGGPDRCQRHELPDGAVVLSMPELSSATRPAASGRKEE